MSETGASFPAPTGIARFETDLFVPTYRPVVSGDWELRVGRMAIVPGYWTGPVLVEQMAVLLRGGDSWMSITPFEVESQALGVREARGHVLIFGLGMSWAACACAMLPRVEAVTIVERDPDVLALHRDLDIFAQLPEAVRAGVRLVEGDALTYVPDRPVDLLMPDIWLPLVSDGRVDEVRAMQANVGADRIYFWGQEMEIARHAVAAGRPLDAEGIGATVADWGLPLAATEDPAYPERLAAAAHRWMNGRWF